jgi:hypothetical protein
MIGQNTLDCALGLTTETLSSWRDDGLRGDEEQWMRRHVATCAACEQRLEGFATVARALGRQRDLEPGDRVWRGVQERLAAQRRDRNVLMHHSALSRQEVIAAASVILVVGLLAYVLYAVRAHRIEGAPTSTATSATTPTLASSVIIPGPQLAWQQAHLPPGVEVTMASLALKTLAVAPSDGDVAYLCVAPTQREGQALETNAHIYVTRDRGQNWERGGDVPVGAQPQVSLKAFMLECHIVVDATRPDMAVVETEWVQVGAEGDNSQIASFASVDYGAHWRKLVYPNLFVISPEMATYGSVIFASGSTQTLSRDQTQNRGNSGLWVSHDQMKTWQALALPSGVTPSAFWLNPSTGALLLAANRQESGDSLLLSSTNGGVHWTPLPAPSTPGIAWIVQSPQGATSWRICGATRPFDDTAQPQVNTLTCSHDGGQTWTARPALNLAQNSPKGSQFIASASVLALTSDGAALATTVEGATRFYRLPTGGSVWQDLGPMPTYGDPGPTYSPTSTGGALWLSGSDVFTVTYPAA